MTTHARRFLPVVSNIRGLGLMLGSAFLFALLGLFIKLLGAQYRVWDISVFRFWGGLFLLLALFGRRERLFRPKNGRLMIVRGFTGTIAFIAMVIAIQKITLSAAIVFFYSFPAFAAIFAPLLFGDRPSGGDLLWIAAAMAGVTVLFDFDLSGAVWGQAAAILGAIFAGLTVVLIRKLREDHGPAILYFYFCLIGGLVALGPYLAAPRVPRNAVEWLLVAGIIVSSTGAQLLMNQGFRYCKSWEGGLFMTSEVVYTAVFGLLLLGETVTWRFWIGGALILGSAVAANLKAGNRT